MIKTFPDYRFGAESFTDWVNTRLGRARVDSCGAVPEPDRCFGDDPFIERRLDHGFIVTGVFPWMTEHLGIARGEASEVAIVSRTYLEPDAIEKTPPGVRSLVLSPDPAWWGKDECGLPIITWITAATPESEQLLQVFRYLPLHWLAYVLQGQPVVVTPGLDLLNDMELLWAIPSREFFVSRFTQEQAA
jgi:hypothetical protein